jgi:DNA-binding transcriptional ArsR family regulator
MTDICMVVHMNNLSDQRRRPRDLSCSEKLKVLADKTRLAVLECLLEGPSHVGPLAERLEVEQSLLSHHLKVLRWASLVESERDGRSVLYRVTPVSRVEGQRRAVNLGCCQLHLEPGLKSRSG